ncbi:MAG: hypothetical protein CSA49_00295 [Gammaproteobacteria bacterium]|nr:MAG: hypothetical protein CSA49_00295 [Gammaproteobacteria bacterium]
MLFDRSIKLFLVIVALLPSAGFADDMEIFLQKIVHQSTPVEYLFALDTSSSMGCAVSRQDSDVCVKHFQQNAHQSKLHKVQQALALLINNTDFFPDHSRVGLAYFSDPGSATIQPLKPLSENNGISSHRSILVNEIQQISPAGDTPLLGILLDLGQYLRSLRDQQHNQSRICSAPNDIDNRQQIYLITDGSPSGEKMSSPIKGVPLGTWVKRFVTGNQSAEGFLQKGDGVDIALFEDSGCPATTETDTDTSSLRYAQYQSCLFHVANRFRKLGITINVIAVNDHADNLFLKTVANITTGRYVAPASSVELAKVLQAIVADRIQTPLAATVLSPGLSVNHGAVLSNTDDVYYPMFTAHNRSFQRSFLYGNLKKYRLQTKMINGVATTAMVDANGNEATEICDREMTGKQAMFAKASLAGPSLSKPACFKASSKSFWSSETDGAVVTKGGSAAKQGVFGKTPDGGRRIYIQNGHDLGLLELVSPEGQTLLEEIGKALPRSNGPDASVYKIDEANLFTRNYFAQLVPVPESPDTVFASYSELLAHDQAETLKNNVAAHNMLRWLIGYDLGRFDQYGDFNELLAAANAGNTERDLLVNAEHRSLAPDMPANEALQSSRLYYGAIVHSQPAVVNYAFRVNGDAVEYDNVIFVSGNDGFLRIINADTGKEQSSFFPASLVKNIPAMYRQSQGALAYGLDSTWTPWRQDLPRQNRSDGQIKGKAGFPDDGAGFVRLYGGMRRGGRSYYFLDVTNRKAPELLAEIKGGEAATDSGPFARMGQTWSQPALAKIKINGKPVAVAVFGGGYDPDYDSLHDRQTQGPCVDKTDAKVICGNQVYMVKAGGYAANNDTSGIGDIVWWASNEYRADSNYTRVPNMKHSIPAKVKVLDINGDGLADRLYVGDLGGQIFRVNINNNGDNSTFSVVTLAQLGLEGNELASDADNRVFFESPSVAVMNNGGHRYVGVALASGWRAKPNDTLVAEKMYFIRDNINPQDDWLLLKSPEGNEHGAGWVLPFNTVSSVADFDNARGISVAMNLPGEKAIGSPVILFGNVIWPTYIPPAKEDISLSHARCLPASQRSRVAFFRVQSGSEELVLNNDGTVDKISSKENDLPALYHRSLGSSVPVNGLNVHLSHNAVSILAGTQAITFSREFETAKRTRWKQEKMGLEAIPANSSGAD